MCRYHIDASHLPIICIIDPRTGLKVRDYDGQTIKADDLATIRKSPACLFTYHDLLCVDKEGRALVTDVSSLWYP